MRSLLSVDRNLSSLAAVAEAKTSLASVTGRPVRIGKVAPVTGGYKANFDILAKKGDTLPYGYTFNSARRYRFNDATFAAAGIKLAQVTRTVTEWAIN